MIEPTPFGVSVLDFFLSTNSSTATDTYSNITTLHSSTGSISRELASLVALSRSGLVQRFVVTSSSIIFQIVFYIVRYQITTLTVIESPGEYFQSSKKSDEKSTGVFARENEAQDIYEKETRRGSNDTSKKTIPITSGIRRTARYLYALGGLSQFSRGIQIMLLWSFSNWLLGIFLRYFMIALGLKPGSSVWASAIMRLSSTLFLMPLSLAWAHTIMAQDYIAESTRSWNAPLSLNRLLSFQTAMSSIRRIGIPRLPPTPILRAAFIPYSMTCFLQFFWNLLPDSFIFKLLSAYLGPGHTPTPRDPTPNNRNLTVAVFTLIVYCEILLIKFGGVFIHGIADMAIIRVQASLLPEDSQTIVPADRKIGVGVLVDRQVNRRDKWRMLLEAWQSTSWGMIWRYIKMRIKWELLLAALVSAARLIIAFLNVFNPEYESRQKTWPWQGPE